MRAWRVWMLFAVAVGLGSCSEKVEPRPMQRQDVQAPADGAALLPPNHPPIDSGDAESAAAQDPGMLRAAGIVFDIPETWTRVEPSSSMRLAQFALPGEAGAAELTVFAFGPGQGGGTQANIDRWIGQFENTEAPDQPAPSSTETFEMDGLTVWLVRAQGRYDPGTMGGMAPATAPVDDAALFGVIVEGGPSGAVFLKAAGPRATMEAHDAALEAMARSARKS